MAGRARGIQVPIDAAAPVERQGSITMNSRTEDVPTGLYSFTFYCRPGLPDKDLIKYLIGMNFYRMLVSRPEFSGWKFIIYLDQFTLDTLAERPANIQAFAERIFQDPLAILALVDWPEYTWPGRPGTVDDTIMRCMRYHAFHHFTDIPIYVRDADTTLFLTAKLDEGTIQAEFAKHSQWEILFKKYYNEFSRRTGSQFSMLYSTTVEYEREWHRNARLPVKGNNRGYEYRDGPLLGIYAGMMACQGNVPEWKSGELWAASLEYLRSICQFVPATGSPSNIAHSATLRIGKDEQLPLFIWFPILYGRIFFYQYRFATPNPMKYWELSRSKVYQEVYKLMTRKYPKIQKLSNAQNGRVQFTYNDEFLMDPADKLADTNVACIIEGTCASADEMIASQEEVLKRYIKEGITDRDDPILEYTILKRHPDIFTFPLDIQSYYKIKFKHNIDEEINPYSVLEPFRNLRYHEFIFFAFRAFIRNYVLVCDRESVHTEFTRHRANIEREIAELPEEERLPTTTRGPLPPGGIMSLFAASVPSLQTPKGGYRNSNRSRRNRPLRKRKTLRKRR